MRTTLTQLRARFGFVIPEWYTEAVHEKVLDILAAENKLVACKYLREVSREQPVESQQLYLKESKEICDYLVDQGLDDNELFAKNYAEWLVKNPLPEPIWYEEHLLKFLKQTNTKIVIKK